MVGVAVHPADGGHVVGESHSVRSHVARRRRQEEVDD